MSGLRHVSLEGVRFLERYADEVALLASGLAELQNALSSIHMLELAPEAAVGLQRLDEYTQKASALAEVATQMGRATVLDRKAVNLLTASLRLAALAARLEGEAHSRPEDTMLVELF